MSADIMALYGPGSRIDGYPRHGRNTPPPGARERLEAGLERLHRLWTDMVARYVDTLDAETPDADLEPNGDLEPSLAGRAYPAGACGNDDDREEDCEDEGAEHDGREPDEEESTLGWSEAESLRGSTGNGGGCDEAEHSLGSLGGTATSGASQLAWSAGEGFDKEEEHDGREPEHEGLNGDEADHSAGEDE